MISGSRSIACGFSILAITAARPRISFLASSTSSARCTKDSAIQSTPVTSAASRSARSFGVIAETGRSVSGRLTPLRSDILPPITTRVTARSGEVSSAISRTLPSSSSSAWPGRSAARISGCGRWTRVLSPGALSESSTKLSPFLSWIAPSANDPSAELRALQVDQDADRAAIAALDIADGLDQFAHLVVRGVAHIDAEHVGAGLEQLADHRAVGRGGAKRCQDLDAAQASHCLLPGAGGRPDPPGGVPPGAFGIPGRPPGPPGAFGIPGTRCEGVSLAFGQLHGPGALLAGIDLEEAGAVETARQAILGALDGEFLVARAHECLSRPFAAAVVIERVDIIKPRDKRAAQQGFAASRGHVPPAFGGPALGILVAERDADPARGIVAETEVRRARNCSTGTSPQAPAPGSDRRSCEREGDGGGGNLLRSFSEAISIP